MEKKNIVITIARQYGSGGKTVGEMLANELGIHYYDKELAKIASEVSGINEAMFVTADENKKNLPLFKSSKSAYQGEVLPPESADFTSDEASSIYEIINSYSKFVTTDSAVLEYINIIKEESSNPSESEIASFSGDEFSAYLKKLKDKHK